MFLLVQSAKILILLSQPFNAHFYTWFFGMTRHPPYSWSAFDEVGLHGPIPYSLLWYAFYYPLTWLGYWPYFLTTFTIDTILLWRYGRASRLWFLYVSQFGAYFLLVAPHDFLIWIFILLGRYRKGFLALAIATKLPLIPPWPDPSIWSFIFFSPISLHDPTNQARYLLLASTWAISATLYRVDHGARIPRPFDKIAWTLKSVFH
jgi:hypothetical protein